MPNLTSNLTSRQAKFVAEYVRTGNATQSAIAAGYSEKTAKSVGSENLTKPAIHAALQAVNATATQIVSRETTAAIASAEWIVREAVSIVQSGGRDRVQALALLAKRHPEFKDSVSINVDARTLQLPDGTTLDDLRALARELRDGIR